ncbi:MAG: TIGR02147 family protein [Bdellovibrionales bacterium]|nr:TIGR02147 family protein [Bdellovibrionales bacterium]
MFSIYQFTNYRSFIEDWILQQNTKGLKSKIAQAIGLSSSMMSLILKGEKQLSQEKAVELSDFIGLNEEESDYLLFLVDFDRAGSQRLKNKIAIKIKRAQDQAAKVERHIKKNQILSPEVMSIYYSSWIYAAIRNCCALPHLSSENQLAHHLNLPVAVVHRVVNFMLQHNLITKREGRFTPGSSSTFIPFESPHVNKHHQNWRHKSIEHMESKNREDLFFTMPMTLAEEDFKKVKELLLKTIKDTSGLIEPSPSETFACLNIDLFKL